MNDVYTKYHKLQQDFAKGEITFEDYSRDIIQWGSDFRDIIKGQVGSQDLSHGGKLVQKKIVDKKGHEVTKWVNPFAQEKTGKGGKSEEQGVKRTPKSADINEFSRSLEEWEKAVTTANLDALKKASKYAARPEIRKLARNEIFKRSHNVNKFIDLSLMPDFMLNDYVARYNQKPLSSAETGAINQYRDNGYVRVNKSLRGEGVELSEEEKQTIKTLDKLIDNSELANDITLYRGLSAKNALHYINYLKSLDVGEVFEEEAFTSSSLTKTTASKFSKLYNSANNITLKIYASKGQKALSMQNLGDESNQEMYKDEYEFLLPRKQKFQVVESNDNEISVILV